MAPTVEPHRVWPLRVYTLPSTTVSAPCHLSTQISNLIPRAASLFRDAVGATDALIIASPEYAHGISGVLKNALDWLVSYEGFVALPVAVINTSPRAPHAYDSLLEVLKTMSATLVPEASIGVPLLGGCITEAQMVNTAAIALPIRGGLLALNSFLRFRAQPGPSFPVESR